MYSNESSDKSRIVLVSDGKNPSVEDTLVELIKDGVPIDTVLYG